MTKTLGLGILAIAVAYFSYGYAQRFLDWLRFQSIGTRDYIHERLNKMFIEVPLNTILAVQFALSFGIGGIVFVLWLPNWIAGVFFGFVATFIGWKLPKPVVDMMYSRRVDKFVMQMIDALSLMSNGLKSGLSVPQSVGLVTQEMPNPIRQEFNLVLSQTKLGASLEEAFTELSKRIDSDDVEMFVTSVNILQSTGGNLAETFDTIVMTIRERVKVEQKIKSVTRQNLIQAFTVMAVPPGMAIMFYLQDPDYMRPMFTTPIGWAILVLVFVLEIVAFFVIRKIMKIEI